MPSNFVFDHSEDAAQIQAVLAFEESNHIESAIRLSSYLDAVTSGARRAKLISFVGAVSAVGTLTLTGLPTAADTFSVNGVSFEAKASGATGDEFNIGSDETETAQNIVAAVVASASADVSYITASSVAGVVTFSCDVPGLIGNQLTLTESLDNATAVDFAGGSDGEKTEINLAK